MPQDNLQKAYDSAKQHYDLPDFNSFKSDMSDPSKLEKFRVSLSKFYDVPDSSTFQKDMGVSKNVNSSGKPLLPGQEPLTQGQKDFLEHPIDNTIKAIKGTWEQLISPPTYNGNTEPTKFDNPQKARKNQQELTQGISNKTFADEVYGTKGKGDVNIEQKTVSPPNYEKTAPQKLMEGVFGEQPLPEQQRWVQNISEYAKAYEEEAKQAALYNSVKANLAISTSSQDFVSNDYQEVLKKYNNIDKRDESGQLIMPQKEVNDFAAHQFKGYDAQLKDFDDKIASIQSESSTSSPLNTGASWELVKQYGKTTEGNYDRELAISNLQDARQDVVKQKDLLNKILMEKNQNRNNVAQEAITNPRSIIDTKKEDLVYKMSLEGARNASFGNNELSDALGIDFKILSDGTPIKKVLDSKAHPFKETSEDFDFSDKLQINKNDLQKYAKEGISSTILSLSKNLAQEKEELSGILDSPDVQKKLADMKKSGQVDEQFINGLKQQTEGKIKDFQTKVEALNKIIGLNHEYFKDYDRWQYDKDQLEKYAASGVHWKTDFVIPFNEGFTNKMMDAAVQVGKIIPAQVKGQLGIISPEQEMATTLGVLSDREFDYMRMQPDYLKNMPFLDTKKLNSISNLPHAINTRSLFYNNITGSIGSLMLYAPAWVVGAGEAEAVAFGATKEFAEHKLKDFAAITVGAELQLGPDELQENIDRWKKGEMTFTDAKKELI